MQHIQTDYRKIQNIGPGLNSGERSFLVEVYSGGLKSGMDFFIEPK